MSNVKEDKGNNFKKEIGKKEEDNGKKWKINIANNRAIFNCIKDNKINKDKEDEIFYNLILYYKDCLE